VKRSLLLVAIIFAVCSGCALVAGIEPFQLGLAIDAGDDAELVDASIDASDAFVADAGTIIDATPVDAVAVCPSLCAEAGVGTCDPNGTCDIDCVAAGTCTGPITCPPGIPCTVTCTGATSCTSTVACGGATKCIVDCIGAGSCSGKISCTGEACEVDCTGALTCLAGVCCDAGSCSGAPTACQ
jgi:hypothetical protein